MVATAPLILAGCASTRPTPARPTAGVSAVNTGAARPGAYYEDDGPGANPPANLDQIADAVPRVEPYASGPNKPYEVFGKEYVPDTSQRPYLERGIGSWYGRKFNGQRTSSGEIYDMYAMTAAHPTLPIPSYARVTDLVNGRSVIVRINDRGPFHSGRVIDLSYAAANKLGYARQGSAEVEVERLLPRDILAGRYRATPTATLNAERAPLTSSGLAAASVQSAPIPALTGTPVAVPAPVSSGPQGPYADLPPDLRPTESPAPGPQRENATRVDAVSSPEAPAGAHYLQLGAFHVQLGADDFMRHMARELEPALASRLRIVASDRFYRVQLGPYADRAQAEGAAQKVRDDLGITPLIVDPR